MKKTVVKPNSVFVPPAGYVTELAKLCGCTRATVNNALRKNMRGEKAEIVRRVFRTKYAEYLNFNEIKEV